MIRKKKRNKPADKEIIPFSTEDLYRSPVIVKMFDNLPIGVIIYNKITNKSLYSNNFFYKNSAQSVSSIISRDFRTVFDKNSLEPEIMILTGSTIYLVISGGFFAGLWRTARWCHVVGALICRWETSKKVLLRRYGILADTEFSGTRQRT